MASFAEQVVFWYASGMDEKYREKTLASESDGEPDERGSAYDSISPTAWSIAYRRTFSDIPYSKEIFAELEKIRIASQLPDIPEEWKTSGIAPQFEARYKLVNRLLDKTGINQILEAASGLSPRGLAMTANPAIEYIEVDLPNIISQKKMIAATILGGRPRSNLHLEAGDALDLAGLKAATSSFDPDKPIAVVNEGLLRYLSFDQKAAYAKNVLSLLNRYGGVWITPDITLRETMEREDVVAKGNNARIKTVTGVDIDKNRFENVQQAKNFFEDLGFAVEVHSLLEIINELKSPKAIGQTQKETEYIIGAMVTFVMRPRSN